MKNQKFNYREYEKLKKLSLEAKICRAEQLIGFEIKQSKKPIVCCSWGKDSIVLLHLVRKICKNVLVVFHNTLIEYPQTYKYRDLILKEWNITNYVETKPIKTFFECVKIYGYPKFRQMAMQGKQRTPKCCYYMKEKPAMDFNKLNKVDCEFLGLQASESMVRRLSFFREGEVFDSKRYKTRIVRPLMIWTDKDIWEYHDLNNIPKNMLYKLMKRNGCMSCTAFRGWREVMQRGNPKLYSYISKNMGQPLINEWCSEAKKA